VLVCTRLTGIGIAVCGGIGATRVLAGAAAQGGQQNVQIRSDYMDSSVPLLPLPPTLQPRGEDEPGR
jgi:hypothetical protein